MPNCVEHEKSVTISEINKCIKPALLYALIVLKSILFTGSIILRVCNVSVITAISLR